MYEGTKVRKNVLWSGNGEGLCAGKEGVGEWMKVRRERK